MNKYLILLTRENHDLDPWLVKKGLHGEYNVALCKRIEDVSQINKFKSIIEFDEKFGSLDNVYGVITDGLDYKDLLTLHILKLVDILPPEVPGDLPGIIPRHPMFMTSLDQVNEDSVMSLKKELDAYFETIE